MGYPSILFLRQRSNERYDMDNELRIREEGRTTVHSTVDLGEVDAGVSLLVIGFHKLGPCWSEGSAMVAIGREVFDEPGVRGVRVRCTMPEDQLRWLGWIG